jgi:hypothetical protein
MSALRSRPALIGYLSDLFSLRMALRLVAISLGIVRLLG